MTGVLFPSLAQLAPTPAAPSPAQAAAKVQPERNPAIWQAAQDFESFFITQMLELQSSTIPTDGPFGGGQTEQVFRSMLNAEHAKAVTQRGGLGIADNVYREILALQEGRRA